MTRALLALYLVTARSDSERRNRESFIKDVLLTLSQPSLVPYVQNLQSTVREISGRFDLVEQTLLGVMEKANDRELGRVVDELDGISPRESAEERNSFSIGG